jgi:uncharacterized protein YggE
VSGHAEILTPPDRASIDIGVINDARTVALAMQANRSEMTRVLGSIRAVGVGEKSISTSDFSIEAVHPNQPNGGIDESKTSGYRVTNKVTVAVTDLSKVSAIIDAATTAGANSSNSVTFDVSDRAALNDQVGQAAVRNAHHRAENLLTAEGAKIGRMISMTTENRSEPAASPEIVVTAALMAPPPTPILPGQVSISADVVVTYAIE